jgi:hypothetical protein
MKSLKSPIANSLTLVTSKIGSPGIKSSNRSICLCKIACHKSLCNSNNNFVIEEVAENASYSEKDSPFYLQEGKYGRNIQESPRML